MERKREKELSTWGSKNVLPRFNVAKKATTLRSGVRQRLKTRGRECAGAGACECVRVCASVCECVRVRARVCGCVRVCVSVQVRVLGRKRESERDTDILKTRWRKCVCVLLDVWVKE